MAHAALLLAVLTFSLCAPPPVAGELASVEHPVEEGRPLRLLIVGDWGRKGMYNQSRVAAQVCLCKVLFHYSFKNSTFIRARLFLYPLFI